MAGPGMRISVAPSPHILFLEDYEYYDHLGRDPLQQNKIWSISDPNERVEKLRDLLDEYLKQKHRRGILLKAVTRGDEAIVRFLVGTGLKVHPQIPTGQSEERGSENANDEDIEDMESIPDRDDPSNVPVHAAASNGKLECLEILLEEGEVDIEARDEFGRTPLIAAVGSHNTEIFKYVLGKGADPTARSHAEDELTRQYMGRFAGADALEMAAAQPNIEVVKLLLEHPFYGSTRKRKHRENNEPGVWVTPLAIQSAAGRDFETLKLLLERGAYPLEGKDGKTKSELLNEEQKQAITNATPSAAESGNLKSLKLLLSYQYPSDENGNLLPFEVPPELHKPFVWGAYTAMRYNDVEAFEFFNGFGLKEHDTMSLEELPEGQLFSIQHLLEAAAENGSIDCARLMIEKYGANPNFHRIPSCTLPLYGAAANNKPEMIHYLLENHKVDIHLGAGRFATGPTALWIAIHLKSLDCIALLLQHGGPVDHIDEEILNISKPMTAILMCESKERTPVRLETEENVREYIESWRNDWQISNAPYVRVEIGPDDREWIRNLQQRKSDEELREEGEGGRELNEREAEDLDETDPRRQRVKYPTIEKREEELQGDEDLIPPWRPAFVPVR